MTEALVLHSAQRAEEPDTLCVIHRSESWKVYLPKCSWTDANTASNMSVVSRPVLVL